MSKSLSWFNHPTSIDEIPEYLDEIFSQTDKNVWSKLLRGCLTKEWQEKLSHNLSQQESTQEEKK